MVFGEFTMKLCTPPNKKNGKSVTKLYTLLTLNAGHILIDNRNNVTMQEYLDYIHSVLIPYLHDRYGIDTDFQNVKFQKMEINLTIPIQGNFSEYKRILSLFETLLPGRGQLRDLKKNIDIDSKTDVLFSKNNKSEEFVIYDKAESIRTEYSSSSKIKNHIKHLNRKLSLLEVSDYRTKLKSDIIDFETGILQTCEESIRFELRLFNKTKDKSHRKKIEHFFDIEDSSLSNINDALLEKKFTECLYKKLLYPFCRWYKKNKQQVQELVKEYKTMYGKSWQQYFYTLLLTREIRQETLLIIDFSHLHDVLNFNDEKHGINMKHNLSAILKGFKNKEPKNPEITVLAQNDFEKILEIFDKLQLSYDESFVRYQIPNPDLIRKWENHDKR